jgi:hypothetical protein
MQPPAAHSPEAIPSNAKILSTLRYTRAALCASHCIQGHSTYRCTITRCQRFMATAASTALPNILFGPFRVAGNLDDSQVACAGSPWPTPGGCSPLRGGYVLPALSAAQSPCGETIRMPLRMTNHHVCTVRRRVALGTNVSLVVDAHDALQHVGHAHNSAAFSSKVFATALGDAVALLQTYPFELDFANWR